MLITRYLSLSLPGGHHHILEVLESRTGHTVRDGKPLSSSHNVVLGGPAVENGMPFLAWRVNLNVNGLPRYGRLLRSRLCSFGASRLVGVDVALWWGSLGIIKKRGAVKINCSQAPRFALNARVE